MVGIFGKMQTEGYMIVLKPEPFLARYEESYMAQENPGPLRELREAFATFHIERYRGISRYPLLAYPSREQGIIDAFEATGLDMKSNAGARLQERGS